VKFGWWFLCWWWISALGGLVIDRSMVDWSGFGVKGRVGVCLAGLVSGGRAGKPL
jgi:hypothetical protein